MGTVAKLRPIEVLREKPGLSEFELFWECYPRKKSKGDALKAWKQTEQKRPHIEEILASIETQWNSHDWQKDGGQFIPYPASWLRDWGWENE